MFNFKLTGFVALGAFALSFIIGLISGVTAGALFLRGLFWALVMGGLFAGGRIIFKKFLPEFFDSSRDAQSETDEDVSGDDDESSQGDNVNIVLDEDGEYIPAGDYRGEREDRGEVSGSPEQDYASPPPGGSYASPERSRGYEDDEGELETLDSVEHESGSGPGIGPAARENSGPGSSGKDRRRSSDDEEELEEVEDLDGGETEGDIGAFEAQFAGDENSGLDSLPETAAQKRSVEILGGEHDPEEAAMAIKTMMKKDQEG